MLGRAKSRAILRSCESAVWDVQTRYLDLGVWENSSNRRNNRASGVRQFERKADCFSIEPLRPFR
jgi:hypothetical protein